VLKWPRYYSTINIFQTLFFSNYFVLNISRRRRYRTFLILKREHSFSHVHLLNSRYVAAATLFFSCVLSPLSCSSNKFVFSPHLGVCKTFAFLCFLILQQQQSRSVCRVLLQVSRRCENLLCCQRE